MYGSLSHTHTLQEGEVHCCKGRDLPGGGGKKKKKVEERRDVKEKERKERKNKDWVDADKCQASRVSGCVVSK